MTAPRLALLALVFAAPALADDPLPKRAVARLGSTRWRGLVNREYAARFEFAPDGKSLVCLSPAETVTWVDIETGRIIKQVRGPVPFDAFRLTPDGKTLLTADASKQHLLNRRIAGPAGLRAWDVSGAAKQSWFLERDPGRIVADARHAAVVGERDVSLVDVRTGKSLWSKPFGDEVRTILAHGFAPDGTSVLAVAGRGDVGSVHAWDVATGERRKLAEFDTPHSGFVLSSDASVAASFLHENVVRRWDLRTGKPLPPLVGHDGEVVAATTFSRDGRTVVSSGDDRTVRWWDAATGKELGRIKTAAVVAAMRLSPDGKTLAAACMGEDVLRRFDLTTRRELPPPDGHVAEIMFLAFAADGNALVTVANEDAVIVWDPRAGKVRRRFAAGTFGQFYTTAMSPDGRLLANANGRNGDPVRLWDLATGRAVRKMAAAKGEVSALAFAPDGKTLAVYRNLEQFTEPSLGLWDLTGKELWRAAAGGIQGGGLRFAADGKRLWSARVGVGPYGWDAATGRAVARTEDGFYVIAVSPDGRTVAGRRENEEDEMELRLIEAVTGEVRLRFGRTTAFDRVGVAYGPMAFSPDGRTVAAGVLTAVVVWDAGTGKEVRRFDSHERYVRTLAFSPDGKVLASGSDDSTVLLWDVAAAAPR